MVTESPIRLPGNSGGRNWAVNKRSSTFTLSKSNVAAQELGIPLKGDGFQGNEKTSLPNRSGSAPPSMCGSLASVRSLMGQWDFTLDRNLGNLSNIIEGCESEAKLLADPASYTYHCSNASLNLGLASPSLSQKTQQAMDLIGGLGDNWRKPLFYASNKGSLRTSNSVCAAHKEELDDDSSPKQESDDHSGRNFGFASAGFRTPSEVHRYHKSLLDLMQHVLERGKPHERSQKICKLARKIVQVSQNKFASNVLEKCLEHADITEREVLIEEILGQTEGNDNLLKVKTSILEICR